MATLTATDIDAIAVQLAQRTSQRADIAEVRARYPGVSFTCCDASDMRHETPYRTHAGFDLYLVDGGGHCWQLTNDPQRATGLLVVQHG